MLSIVSLARRRVGSTLKNICVRRREKAAEQEPPGAFDTGGGTETVLPPGDRDFGM